MGLIDNLSLMANLRSQLPIWKYHLLLNWYVLNRLLLILIRNIFSNCFISDMRDIFSFMFNLLIVGIWHINWLINSMLNSLIVGYDFLNWNLYSQSCCMLFSISSVIRNLFMGNNRGEVSVIFLQRNVFHIGLCLRSSFSTMVYLRC